MELFGIQIDIGLAIALFAILIVAIIAASKFIINWLYDIPKRNKLMEAQLMLLANMALVSGVSKQKVAEIVNAGISGYNVPDEIESESN